MQSARDAGASVLRGACAAHLECHVWRRQEVVSMRSRRASVASNARSRTFKREFFRRGPEWRAFLGAQLAKKPT